MMQDWNTKVILIAEDEPANYLFLEKILKPSAAHIIHAENGRDAVEHVKNNPNIDLVLMDIYMPELNGFEASKMIKTLKPKLPVIAQTFHQQESDGENYITAGFDAIIRKPVNINKLFAILEHFLKSEI
jgi:CheY-like chemotaxis protein